jgi:GTP cyclohydrolase I
MMRGVKKSDTNMTTRTMLGDFKEDAALRSDFMALVTKSYNHD